MQRGKQRRAAALLTWGGSGACRHGCRWTDSGEVGRRGRQAVMRPLGGSSGATAPYKTAAAAGVQGLDPSVAGAGEEDPEVGSEAGFTDDDEEGGSAASRPDPWLMSRKETGFFSCRTHSFVVWLTFRNWCRYRMGSSSRFGHF